MVGVDRLDIGGHLRDPAAHELPRAIAAPGLVGELPGEDRWIISIEPTIISVDPIDEVTHVILVELAAARVRVERVGARARGAPANVLRHPAEVSPVVHEADEEPHARLVSLVEDIVHRAEGRLVIDPRSGLERRRLARVVEEPPGPEDGEAQALGHGHGFVRVVGRAPGRGGDQVIGVAAHEIEGPTIQHELPATGRDEPRVGGLRRRGGGEEKRTKSHRADD